MPQSVMFVQFPHPGPEHRPTGPWMDWNRRDHARKFLKAEGSYISNRQVRTGSFAFWGEWEPQSRVIETFPAARGGYPRWLHEPYWQVPSHRRLLQNTDPLVFGERFLYSNCRHQSNRKLRELVAGSLIVFGSKVDGEFVLDTVLVVGDNSRLFTQESAEEIDCHDWIRAVVFDPLSRSPKRVNEPFRLYWGRTYDEAPTGPFSFVPCRPYVEGGSAFPRPTLRLPQQRITPNLAQGAKATPASQAEIMELWDGILEQVAQAGLSLGVRLDPPPRQEAVANAPVVRGR